MAAALLTCAALQPASPALAQAASPFPEVPVPAPPARPYGWSAVSLLSGAMMIGASFGLVDAADRRYSEYQNATDPARIADLYDQAVLLDRFSTATIIGGELLIATGIYLAFLRRPEPQQFDRMLLEPPRLGLRLEPSRCGVALRF